MRDDIEAEDIALIKIGLIDYDGIEPNLNNRYDYYHTIHNNRYQFFVIKKGIVTPVTPKIPHELYDYLFNKTEVEYGHDYSGPTFKRLIKDLMAKTQEEVDLAWIQMILEKD